MGGWSTRKGRPGLGPPPHKSRALFKKARRPLRQAMRGAKRTGLTRDQRRNANSGRR
jgi:hypothetical protein